VQGAVEQFHPLADEDVRRVLGLGRGVEPGLGLGLVLQRREGADRGRLGKWQLGRLGAGLGALWPAAPARAGRGSSEGAEDEDALALAGGAGSRQVAPVRQGQRAGEVELRESE
jgi:hypothetical protein